MRALYGLKSSGAAFRAHLVKFMADMGYKPCKADPDLWMKPMTKPQEKDRNWKVRNKDMRYYAYILCYVDDLLVIHHNPKSVMDQVNEHLPLKPDSVGPPKFYLGAKLSKAWALNPTKYVREAAKNVETDLQDKLQDYYLVNL